MGYGPINVVNGGSSVSAAIQNPGAFTGNLTVNGSITPTKDYAIQGKMLRCERIISQEQFEKFPKSEIKKMMIADMVEEMLKADCIEFTMTQTQPHEDLVRVRARVYVTPNDQVKLLREKGY